MEDATTGGSATVRAGVFNDGLLTLAPPAPIGITVTTASDAVFLVLPQPALIAVVKQFKARPQHPRQTKNSLASVLTWLAWLGGAQGFEQYMVDSEGGKNEGAAKMNRSGSTVFKLGKLLAKEARKRIGGNTPRPLPSPTNAQQQPNRHHSLLNDRPSRPA